MTTYYLQTHASQYGSGASAITRSSGCTWTSTANGIAASSGGKNAPTPDQVHAKVARSEETNPVTPGWSLQDAALASKRLGVGFEIRSGRGWAAAVAASDAGYYIVLQGDSDQFGNATCSGAFDGDHAIGWHPAKNAQDQLWINDPICPAGRWESPRTLRLYAEKLSASVRFGIFTTKVPTIAEVDMTLFFKPDNPSPTGTAAMNGPGHSLIAFDGRFFGNRPDGELYRVWATGTIHNLSGQPMDVDSNVPPKLGRERVYAVDRDPWGNSTYVLMADVRFTPDIPEAVVPPSAIACKPYVDAALASAVVEHRIVSKP